ncbi:MAG: hypothetical protein E7261_04490 [Lachnospiraceae bacterium]|nr:hypothetical protein [Lachnospiraceae bacterium]
MFEWIISSGILIIIIVVLRYALKGKISLRLQYALWGLVLLRLLVPFSIGNSSISIMNVADKIAEQSVWQPEIIPEKPVLQPEIVPDRDKEQENIPGVIPSEVVNNQGEIIPSEKVDIPGDNRGEYEAFDKDAYKPIENNKQEYSATDVTGMPMQGTETPDKTEPLTFAEVLAYVKKAALYVWISGIILAGGYFVFVNVRFSVLLKKNRRLLEYIDGFRLPVYVAENIDTPCMYGLVRPVIYVTPEATKSEKVLKHVLEHESTHYRHADHIWCVLRGIALVLHWYNPLVWLAAVLSRNDSELACDEGTIKRIGENERADYGRTLIEMTCQKHSVLFVNATTMTGSKKSIKERIVLIAKKPKMALYTLVAVVVIAVIAVGCTFTGAGKDNTTVSQGDEVDSGDEQETTTGEEQPTTTEEQPTSSGDEKETTGNTEETNDKENSLGTFTWRVEGDTIIISGTGTLTEGKWYKEEFKHLIIEEGITDIDDRTFWAADKVESIVIPGSIKSVGNFDCSNLKEVILKEGVETIESGAFAGCAKLEKIIIPSSVTSIEEIAFEGCISLADIEFPETSIDFGVGVFAETKWLKEKRKESSLVIVCDTLIDASGAVGEVVVPDGIRIINEFAFAGESKVTSVILPESLESVEYRAFYGNDAIENVTFSGGNYIIEPDVFGGCSNLKEVKFSEGLISIGYEAFYICTSLEKIVFPKSLESLGGRAFEACAALKEVVFPEGFTGFEGNVFVRTAWLEEKQKESPFVIINGVLIDASTAIGKVTVPEGVVIIAEDAFTGKSYLGDEFNVSIEEVVISDGVSNIASGAFNCCYRLKKVTIPESVVSIGDYAFDFSDLEIIRGKKGSYAESYAKQNNIAFEEIPLSFAFDGSAREAAEYFVNTVYGDIRMNKLAPGSMAAITFYELIEYNVLEISEDDTKVVGTFKFAYDAENVETNPWIAGFGDYGEGKYEGMYTDYKYFRLFKAGNNQWSFSVTTG